MQHRARAEPDDRESTRIRFSPWAPVGMLGAAGGMELLRRSVLPTQLTEDMKRFAEHTKLRQDMGYDLAAPEATRALHNLADYAIQGNKIMSARIAGLKPLDIVRLFRSTPLVAQKDRWVPGVSDLHYKAFEQGPLPAFNHLLSELTYGWNTGDVNVPATKPSVTGNIASVLRNYLGFHGVKGPPTLRDDMRTKINELVRHNTGVSNYLDTTVGPSTWNHAATTAPNSVSNADQLRVIRELPAAMAKGNGPLTGLVGENSAQFAKNVAGVQDVLYKNYAKFIQPVLLADNAWKNVNIGLASLGGLGLGAYGLNKYLRYRDDRDKRRSKQASANPKKDKAKNRSWLLPAALLSGAAGAGALALRHTAFPESFLQELRNFRNINTGKPGDLKDAARALADYSIGGAKIMRHKLFNAVPVKSLLKAIRSLPVLPSSDKWNDESDAHYTAFQKGPTHGFLRYFEELYDDYENPNPSSIQEKIWGAMPADKVRGEAVQGFNKLIGENTGVPNYFNTHIMKGWADRDGAVLSDADQVRALQDLPQWLSNNRSTFPRFAGELSKRQGAVQESLDKYRTKLIDPVLGIAKGLDMAGYAGLGGSGLLGLAAWRMQRETENKKRKTRARQQVFN